MLPVVIRLQPFRIVGRSCCEDLVCFCDPRVDLKLTNPNGSKMFFCSLMSLHFRKRELIEIQASDFIGR